ncbi:ABC transporter permease subunit [Clostridiisalibacter paucivorans]|uniref:ABC transporter permease subunit n=1 Tax=Clostridiisalibacter paucivorans TaxID=408753 RepID=UPI00047A1270|nr:ABC transporter permease [Clostridiisalibacter paucivorans]
MDNIQNVESKKPKSNRAKRMFLDNSVTVLFVIICIIGVKLSKLPLVFIVNELATRLARNSFLVLALLIPVMAGMGLNFSITVGAMAGQIAIITVVHWGVGGLPGFLLGTILAFPLAVLLGNLTGRLLNKTKGNEMIAGMITGYFANGIYQFIFLFLVGTLIPMKNEIMMLSSGVGIRNTVDLARDNGMMYALDEIWYMPLFTVLLIFGMILTGVYVYKIVKSKDMIIDDFDKFKYFSKMILGILVIGFSIWIMIGSGIPKTLKMLKKIQFPMVTGIVVGLACLFNVLITRTKLGQDFRTVGQNRHIAEVSGINVDKIRIIAITISTVLAAWGQMIFLQNMGVLNTYGSHVQIGLFSIAALLIGGASVTKATIGQALLGVILFHTLFIVSPMAGKELFGDAQIGEFFRAFVAYGVIGVSLGLHAWRKKVGKV